MRRAPLAILAGIFMVTTACGDNATTEAPTTSASTVTTAAGPGVGALLERFRNTPVRTTYRFGEGADQRVLVLSQDPVTVPPVSAVISEADGFRIIVSGSDMTMCEAATGQCFVVPGQGADVGQFAAAFLTPFLSSLLAFDVSASTPGLDVANEPVTVAGRSGVCFSLAPAGLLGAEVEEVRQCIDDELGMTLLFETRAPGGEFVRVMELTEVGEPLATDFEPPFPLVELPTE